MDSVTPFKGNPVAAAAATTAENDEIVPLKHRTSLLEDDLKLRIKGKYGVGMKTTANQQQLYVVAVATSIFTTITLTLTRILTLTLTL
jgi:hypothetical protein